MSLIRLIKKNKCAAPHPKAAVAADALWRIAKHPRTILLNCQSVADDVLRIPDTTTLREVLQNFQMLPRPVSPFRCMWAEFMDSDERIGCLIARYSYLEFCEMFQWAQEKWPDRAHHIQHVISLTFCFEAQGRCIGPLGQIAYAVNHENGDVVPDHIYWSAAVGCESRPLGTYLGFGACVIGNALARLNCKNVELRAIACGKPARRH